MSSVKCRASCLGPHVLTASNLHLSAWKLTRNKIASKSPGVRVTTAIIPLHVADGRKTLATERGRLAFI